MSARTEHGRVDRSRASAIDILAEELQATLDGSGDRRLALDRLPRGVRHVATMVNRILGRARKTAEDLGEIKRLFDLKILAGTAEAAAFHQIQEASEAKSTFLATMSHELRTPLNAIIGYSEMLVEDADEEGAAARSLDLSRILSSSHHLLSLIGDVLDLAKVEAGKLELDITEATFEVPIGEVNESLRQEIEGNGSTLHVEIVNPKAKIRTDVRRLKQCLINLICNAAKFTKNGTLTVHAEAQDEEIVISVTDTGIGMTEEQMTRIFAAFTQADGGTRRKYGGSGLGLTITRELVRLLGGEVSVESRLGAGSKFTLRMLRYLETGDKAGNRNRRSTDMPGEGLKGPVLVVGSDPHKFPVILKQLRDIGWPAVFALDGGSGVEAARLLRPAAVILDLPSVGASVLELLGLLRSEQTLAGLPILGMTDGKELPLGVTARVDEILLKPVEPSQLAQFLKTHVQREPHETNHNAAA